MFLKNLKRKVKKHTLKADLEKNNKIPIPIAFLLAIFGLLGGILIINKSQVFFLEAQDEKSPSEIKVTNIDSTSFVVSWLTQNETLGKINYGETSSVDQEKRDIRDAGVVSPNKFQTHFVLVENLKPNTKYFFKINSDGKIYTQVGKPYEITTAVEKPLPPNDIAQGKVLTPSEEPAEGAIVYLTIANTITQAGLVEKNGYWMILLSRARENGLQNYSKYDQSAQIEEILVTTGSQSATATLIAGNDNPAPNIILGQNHNFIKAAGDPTPTLVIIQNTPLPIPTGGGFRSASSSNEITISYPSENEKITSQVPEFFGTGPEGEILEIAVESEEKINDDTEVDNQGVWRWSPTKKLTPGEHTIKVTYTDDEGFIKEVMRNFIVYAEGANDLPSFTATNSGQTTTPTPSASPTVTVSPTTTPPIASPSAQPFKTGNGLPTWFFFSGGVIFVIVGSMFLLL